MFLDKAVQFIAVNNSIDTGGCFAGVVELCPWQEAGSMLIVSFILSRLATALVIRLVDGVLALRGFIKS